MTESDYCLAVAKELKRRMARGNLVDFIRQTFDRYVPSWHHFLMADRLEMLERGEIHRLMMNLPPRHGKSEEVSIRFPAWFLGRNPNKYVIATSYSASLASDFGKKARNVVSSLEFREIFPEAQLSEESAAKLDWSLERTLLDRPCPKCGNINWQKKAFGRAICRTCGALGEFAGSNTVGEYHGAGIGGAVTGKGADLLIIDDPLKDRKQAQSPTYRKNIWDWYISTAITRLHKGGRVCVCQTRWHEDDLSGRLLLPQEDDGDSEENWYLLSLPAIAEEDEEWKIYNPRYQELLNTDTIYRSKGEALWETQYPQKKLMARRKRMTEYEWASLYQQRPQPDGGGLFKRENFRYAKLTNGVYELLDGQNVRRIHEKECTRFTTTDLGITDTAEADYTVIATWDLTRDNDLILRNVIRTQILGAEHINLLWQVYRTLSPRIIGIEKVQYQATLVQLGLKQGLPVKALKADGDKKTRALPAAAKMEGHKVFFVDSLAELPALENELIQFPGRNDDFVDTLAYAVIMATEVSQVAYVPQTNRRTDRLRNLQEL